MVNNTTLEDITAIFKALREASLPVEGYGEDGRIDWAVEPTQEMLLQAEYIVTSYDPEARTREEALREADLRLLVSVPAVLEQIGNRRQQIATSLANWDNLTQAQKLALTKPILESTDDIFVLLDKLVRATNRLVRHELAED